MNLHVPDATLERGGLRFEAGRITEVHPEQDMPADAEAILYPADHHLIPGMIDLHVHGAAGADMMDADPDSLRSISRALAATGVTAFAPTTMTDTAEAISAALATVANFTDAPGAQLLGVHLEGPFLSPRRPGAQRADRMIAPDIALFDRWQQESGGQIRLVTLAPELPGAADLIAQLKSSGVVVSAGHTDASHAQTIDAIEQGCTQATHLFNAMAPLLQREPGPALALLSDPRVRVELIADGVHLHPEILRLAFQLKGAEGIVLITDAMAATGLGDGQYALGGQEVTVRGAEARLADGTLAGSILTMPQAMRQMRQATGCTLPQLIQMTAINPARQLGIDDRKGSLTPGKDADMVVLDADLQLVAVYCRGVAQELPGSDNSIPTP